MPFSIEWEGADELLRKMDKLPEKAAKIAAEAVYEGAGVMADAVGKAIGSIQTEQFKYAKDGKKRLPSPEEKAILEKAKHGVAKFRNDGTVIQTSIGFQNDGYAKISWNHARTNVRTKYKMGKKGRFAYNRSYFFLYPLHLEKVLVTPPRLGLFSKSSSYLDPVTLRTFFP